MTTAYYSTVLDHHVDTVWSLIRDFNNYPAYIDASSRMAGAATRSARSAASATAATGSASAWAAIRTSSVSSAISALIRSSFRPHS